MAIQITANDLQRLEDTLLNTSGNVPLHRRFRALFTLKALKNNDAVRIISKGMLGQPLRDDLIRSPGFSDPSALFKHELAYCLGQMKQTSALPVLESVLRNVSEDPMVRHEVCTAR
jgi:deoxyhypusine monooxygenase